MNLHENTDFGRKIFFLNPPPNFKSVILPALLDKEYELYVIDNYQQAKNILCRYPDSICFVSIDSQIPLEYWYNFIMSFDKDPMLSTIFLGILSGRAGKADREHFLLNAVIPAGFISLNTAKEDLINILHGILEINGAKGQRKYVRADCKQDKLIAAQCVIDDMTYFMSIVNISSIGVSCTVSSATSRVFTVNMFIRDFTLILRNKKIKCNAIIIHSSITQHEIKIVLVFTQGIPHTAKAQIKEYIHLFLQEKIDTIAVSGTPDTIDYSKKQKSATRINDAFLIAVEDEEPPEAVRYADDS